MDLTEVREYFVNTEQIKDVIKAQEAQGFVWDRENSEIVPCRNCGTVILRFRLKKYEKDNRKKA